MIEIKGLVKKYGKFTALNHLDLTIEAGTVFGFVGANGAGKTTTFNMLSTLVAPTEGDAIIAGHSIRNEPQEVRKHIGYMPDFFGVYDQLKTAEYLSFFGASYGMSSKKIQLRTEEVLQLVNLEDKQDEYVDDLSRGMKQRLCLARTLLHNPDVLILDEPASGLDPRARIEMRDVLHSLKGMGKTIIISSHILPELAEICDEIGVIEQGKLIASGDIRTIQKQLSADKIIEVQLIADASLEAAQAFFRAQGFPTAINDQQQLVISFVGDDAELQQLLRQAILHELPIIRFNEVKKDLEDVFMAITQGVK
ncbi:MAG: ABC transporter ATP-binding protein [Kurthia sp.]|nr:ABC transporter ATP-binding protein [Candidatus Kurthia equi]